MKISKDGKEFTNYTEENGVIIIKEDGVVLDCGSGNIIDCRSDCTIFCGSDNTIFCGPDNTIHTKGERNVVIRKDAYEVIELKKGQKIRLNGLGAKGYTDITEEKKETPKEERLEVRITLDGKTYVLKESTK
jgi:hypothetical protein